MARYVYNPKRNKACVTIMSQVWRQEGFCNGHTEIDKQDFTKKTMAYMGC